VVLAADLLRVVDVGSGLKTSGILVLNTPKAADEIMKELNFERALATVDATRIAREMLGVPIVNTAMVGALLKAAGVTKLESLIDPLRHRFGRLADKNINAMQRAYEQTTVRGQE